ncbi:MAG: hypothetical protein PHQ28_03510 [Mycobacterium sp.]|nr:hypothetical protein [Mycobacterium sp.]
MPAAHANGYAWRGAYFRRAIGVWKVLAEITGTEAVLFDADMHGHDSEDGQPHPVDQRRGACPGQRLQAVAGVLIAAAMDDGHGDGNRDEASRGRRVPG